MLYIVSTPIGNLKDITLRAIDTLSEVDVIVSEDTRSTGMLLKAHNIEKKPFISYNDYNAHKRIPEIIEILRQDKTAALVSENGTPAISDPGYKLIKKCIENNIKVVPIPGCTALIPALVASGFPTDKFAFYGFLPKTEKKKTDVFNTAVESGMTSIFYESPHRIKKTLAVLERIIPDGEICIGRELTKRFEEFLRGKPSEIINNMAEKPKGELVLVISK